MLHAQYPQLSLLTTAVLQRHLLTTKLLTTIYDYWMRHDIVPDVDRIGNQVNVDCWH